MGESGRMVGGDVFWWFGWYGVSECKWKFKLLPTRYECYESNERAMVGCGVVKICIRGACIKWVLCISVLLGLQSSSHTTNCQELLVSNLHMYVYVYLLVVHSQDSLPLAPLVLALQYSSQ